VLRAARSEVASSLPAKHGLRDRTEEDLSFLCRLYAQTREEELRPVPWSSEQKADFLRDQFGKQHAHYLQYYPRAAWWLITRDEAPVGRLYAEQTDAELRIMDVSLLAECRSGGLGSALMRALLRHADKHGLATTLHVEPFNPALRLYERLGFASVETRGPYFFMRREPVELN
jgi:ribosomal protein S18 acetylase RimI-like enzyme